jgi:transposase
VEKSFAIGAGCFVADRAMMSEENVKFLTDNHYDYIIAAKLRGMKSQLHKELLKSSNYQASIVVYELSWIGEFKYNNARLILSYKYKTFNLTRNMDATILKK